VPRPHRREPRPRPHRSRERLHLRQVLAPPLVLACAARSPRSCEASSRVCRGGGADRGAPAGRPGGRRRVDAIDEPRTTARRRASRRDPAGSLRWFATHASANAKRSGRSADIPHPLPRAPQEERNPPRPLPRAPGKERDPPEPLPRAPGKERDPRPGAPESENRGPRTALPKKARDPSLFWAAGRLSGQRNRGRVSRRHPQHAQRLAGRRTSGRLSWVQPTSPLASPCAPAESSRARRSMCDATRQTARRRGRSTGSFTNVG
jgi:hypothetical protein